MSSKCISFKGNWSEKASEQSFQEHCDMICNNNHQFNNFRKPGSRFTSIVGMSIAYGKGGNFLAFTANKDCEILKNIDRFKINDRIGNPKLEDHPPYGKISANTLQYMASLVMIKNHIGDLDNKKIVEIGGGYGGFCTVINSFYSPKRYSIVELPAVSKVQRKYISSLVIKGVRCISSEKIYGVKNIDLVISEYCICEFDDAGKNFYLDNIIKNSKNCFFKTNLRKGAKSSFIDSLSSIFDKVLLLSHDQVPHISVNTDTRSPLQIIVCKNNKLLTGKNV